MKLSLALLAAAAALFAQAPDSARAAPRDQFPLGQSAKTGAVCDAERDDQDPAAQQRGATAWAVRCRGWQGTLGHLYLYDRDGPRATGEGGLWRQALAKRANCAPAKALPQAGLSGSVMSECKAAGSDAPYLAYRATRKRAAAAADGLAPLADMMEAGLRIVLGAAQPPAEAVQIQAAAVGRADSGVSLAQAAEEVQRAPELVRERAYTQNQAWLFSDAEAAFRALALDKGAAPRDRAEAYLNWALNVSNLGRFEEADGLFALADGQAALAHDTALDALALNYRSLHLRNQRRFADAVKAAEQALALRRGGRQAAAEEVARGAEIASGSSREIYISPVLAAALNRRDRTQDLIGRRGLTEEQRLAIQDAQALYVIGSAKTALGDAKDGREALETADRSLGDATLLASAGWLKAQVKAELARLDLNAGSPAAAKVRLGEALQALRAQSGPQSLAGSQTEAALVLEYARAEAAGGEEEAALTDYDRGFALFRNARGSLGASADAADVYFDLLLRRRRERPDSARTYDERFFAAAQSVVSEATADTVARLSARMSQGDSASAGVARALEDTRRRLRVKEAELQQAQTAKDVPAATIGRMQTELRALTAEAAKLEAELLAANPRYGQLVIAAAGLDQMQKALEPGEAYVKIVLFGARSYGLLVTRDQVRPYAIPLGRVAVEGMVRRLRRPFDSTDTVPRFDVALSHQLYDALFGPARAEMTGVKHLVFDPDGELISFPAAAFVADQKSVDLMATRLKTLREKGGGALSYAGVGWLGRTADTSLVVSAASFLQSRGFRPSAAPKPYLGFGDAITGSPDDPRLFASVVNANVRRGASGVDFCEGQRRAMAGMRRLTETAAEVKDVGDSLGAPADDEVLGQAFTDAAVKGRHDLDQYRVLYFATHGLLPRSGACLPQPALVTSLGGADSDALLDAVEILDLKLDADLVVLSACNTGGGGGAASETGLDGAGEALGGLARAFIYAGSRGLVVSHWEVDSRSALALMTGMFSASKAGETVSQAEALRRSELSLMDSSDYSHPYYWAAFTVVGDGARPMPAAAPQRSYADGH